MGVLVRIRVARSMEALQAAVAVAASGDLTSRAPLSAPRELAQLGAHLNELIDARDRYEQAITTALDAERDLNEQFRELDSVKHAFLMAISHDLRTPLTSVIGFADVLGAPDVGLSEVERHDCVVRIAAQARRLERLLLDLLDVERMTRGTIEPNLKPVVLIDVIEPALDGIPKDTTLEVDIDPDLIVSADPGLLERVAENLILNAIKHNGAQTRIWIRAEQDAEAVVLVVEDDGPGVCPELRTEIFAPFDRGTATERYSGSGIGLALVAEFAKMHGGRAWVEDRAGGGASFRVRLPAARPVAVAAG